MEFYSGHLLAIKKPAKMNYSYFFTYRHGPRLVARDGALLACMHTDPLPPPK